MAKFLLLALAAMVLSGCGEPRCEGKPHYHQVTPEEQRRYFMECLDRAPTSSDQAVGDCDRAAKSWAHNEGQERQRACFDRRRADNGKANQARKALPYY